MAAPKDPKGPVVTINEDSVLALIEEAKAVTEAIASFSTERKALEANTLADLVKDSDEAQGILEYLEATEAEIARLQAFHLEWQLVISQRVAEEINKVHKGVSLDTLRQQRDDKVRKALVLAEMLGMDIADKVPEMPKVAGTATGTKRAAKVTNARYYRIVDGAQVMQPVSQNSLSSLVFYHSQHASSDGKTRMSTEDFVQWAKAKGVDVKAATPWELPLSDKVTIGMTVTDEKASPEEA